jgi:GTP-binding protein
MPKAEHIRNIAIVAHIDHGKTTLIDSIFRHTRVFRENMQVAERYMDNNELERERGITIRAKHCTVEWGGCRINIIDTPGHADFSGEVERILSMVDSVLLLVDANEGPMPQTRYVLMRALRLGLRPIVVVNKADRPNADPERVVDQTFDLFVELGADDDQCDFPILYGSGLHGWIVRDLEKDAHEGLEALFQTIVERVPAPEADADAPFLMQVSTLGWNDHIGRTGTGRVLQGRIKKGDVIRRISTRRTSLSVEEGDAEEWAVADSEEAKAAYMWATRGVDTVACEEASAGDIITIAGPKSITIGDTIAAKGLEDCALPPLDIEEPTVSMTFMVNNGPFAGQEGTAVTIRQIRERLDKELRTNVALAVEDADRSDSVKVSGRGELHIAILIEEMRREGMELCVSPPEIITRRDGGGALLEPYEELIIETPTEFQGAIIEKVAQRKGKLGHMETNGAGMVRLEFEIPTRGLIGYQSEFLTDTRGLGIIASRLTGYGPWCGPIATRNRGSMISMDTGPATAHSLENLQQRGVLFVSPLENVYEGMIVGESARPGDLPCNPTKRKALTNHRAAGKDHSTGLDVPRVLTLDSALEWIAPDELVEVTPKSIRVRKAVLDAEERKRLLKQTAAQ